jgi:EAL domain-containing protein (putative c-di-GMP-specific phosphodiesterase class I)
MTLGVDFAVDDFGTGYSSLTYLRKLPARTLKIDRSFVSDMLDDPEDLAIVRGVIELAGAFDREVIAEGVETLAHGQALLTMGCHLAQGYGIARPMPASELPAWLPQWHERWLARWGSDAAEAAQAQPSSRIRLATPS